MIAPMDPPWELPAVKECFLRGLTKETCKYFCRCTSITLHQAHIIFSFSLNLFCFSFNFFSFNLRFLVILVCLINQDSGTENYLKIFPVLEV